VIPLFVGYALIVWYAAARHRRRLGGFVAVGLGLLGLIALNVLHGLLNVWTQGEIHLPVLRSIMYPYTAFVFAVGGFIACLPRSSATGCVRCGYPLSGLEGASGAVTCPECGRRNEAGRSYRRSGADRDDLRISDVRRPPAGAISTAGQADDPAQQQDPQGQPGDERPADDAQRSL
jgi:pimeloyl-ACP methyl ester carboxylesterase